MPRKARASTWSGFGVALDKLSLRVWGIFALIGVVLLLVAAWGLHGTFLGTRARLATAYGAHVGCACHFIEGRTLSDCRHDFEPGMALVSLTADEAAHSVSARLLPLASDTAVWSRGSGCVLVRWK